MPIEIVESSPLATEAASRIKAKGPQPQYPFEALQVGQSFKVPVDECNWKSLRVIVSKNNTKYHGERKFKFILHSELNACEVARIA